MKRNFVHIKFLLIPLCLSVGSVFFSSCKKESDVFLKFGNTSNALRNLSADLTNNAENMTILLVDGASTNVILTTSRGVEIHFSEVNSSFSDEFGAPAVASSANPIKIEAMDVFEKREIVGLGTATQADFGQALSSVGMVQVQAFLNGKPLYLRANKTFEVLIPANFGNVSSEVFAFEGGWNNTEKESKFRWSQSSDIPIATIQPTPDGVFFYQILADKIGWISANQFVPNPVDQFHVSLDKRFGLSNTYVFLVLNDKKSVFGLPFDLGTNTFKNDKIPVGQAAKIVCFSKIGNQLFYAERAITTEANVNIDLSNDQNIVSEAGLKAALAKI